MTQTNNSPVRTIVFAVIALSLIGWLVMFSIKKNSESGQRSRQCEEQCSKDGHAGFEFRWDMLSGPKCECLS